jgi:AraC-like DNA-binding protein
VQRIIPTGFCELQLYFSPRPKALNNNKYLTDNTALHGHQNECYDIEYKDFLSVFTIVFQPQGLMQFFKFPLNEIYNINVPLRNIAGQAGWELKQKMGEVNTFEERIVIVENYFLTLLKHHYDDFEFRRTNHIVDLIKQTRGRIGIDQMASEACLSRRQFERVFTEHIGTSPKQYMKIIRFQHALFQKQQNNNLNMTQLSYDSGYYDQSHFINEFKSLSGQTPKQYFKENEACSDFFE